VSSPVTAFKLQELRTRVGPVALAPGPQVAPGEAAEDGRAPGVGPFALKGVEDLLHGVHGASVVAPSRVFKGATPASAPEASQTSGLGGSSGPEPAPVAAMVAAISARSRSS